MSQGWVRVRVRARVRVRVRVSHLRCIRSRGDSRPTLCASARPTKRGANEGCRHAPG